ncbi:MAG TPA: hypothetical protein PKY59_11675 [Pyrinomonadaceae bacterium]|nr:hypothetical protein [Pyrinomonadaceae bacterium]
MKRILPKYLIRSLAVWFVIIFAESIHGTLRTIFLELRIGEFRARQIAVFTGAAIIFTIALIFIKWISANKKIQLLLIGAFWVILTVIFEISLGRFVMIVSWERILSDYKIWEGGLMPIGLTAIFLTPYVAAKLRKIIWTLNRKKHEVSSANN